MEKCKFCGAELEEEVTLCAACGKDNAEEAETEETVTEAMEVTEAEATEAVDETEAEATEAVETAQEAEAASEEEPAPQQQATPRKIVLSVVAIVLLLAMIAGLLVAGMKPSEDAAVLGTIPADGNPDDATCKGSYTASERKINWTGCEEKVVATMGDRTLTNAQLQVFYWNYVQSYMNSQNGYMNVMTGALDLAQPFDRQVCTEDPTITWQQFFLRGALENWEYMQALAIQAEAAGYTISAENQAALDAVPATLQDTAVQSGMADAQELLTSKFGAGVTMEDYLHFERLYYSSIPYYYDETAKLTVTEEEVTAFFDEHEQEYATLGLLRTDALVDVRHILIMPEGATNETIRTETFPEEAWAASELRAQEILAEYAAGEQTEARFAEFANTYTQDGNDANYDGIPDGGLYTGITAQSSLVPEFLAWCIDPARAVGDTAIVKTQFGYHIMFLAKTEPLWPKYAEQDALAMKSNDLITNAVQNNPSNVNYEEIELAAVILN